MALALALPRETAAAAEKAAAAEPVLRAHGLCKRFGAEGPPVLDDVDLQLARGEALALLGANGAGKSTLLRCCLRLVEPDQGRVELLGEPLTGLSRGRLRRLRSRVGFVFQRHNLVPRLSALSNVLHGAQARGDGPLAWYAPTAPRRLREEALACLERVGLARFAGQRAASLSGGQSQRVAIARALMQRPELVVADEPVASLDPAAGEEVMALFVRLLREEGISLLFTSHNLRHALDHSDRLVALRGGRVELEATSASQDVERLRALYD